MGKGLTKHGRAKGRPKIVHRDTDGVPAGVLPSEQLDCSVLEWASQLTDANLERWVISLKPGVLAEVRRMEWWYVRRPDQQAPPGNWLIWLILAGRGWGKSRTGAEWLVDQMLANPVDSAGHPTEWVAVGETLGDCRKVMLGGPSGILNVLRRRGIAYRYVKAPDPQVVLATGQILHGLGADDADVGRGLNLAGGWLDEIAKWRHAAASWTEGLGPALRTKLPGGHKPRVVVTTTPKPIALLKDWVTRTDGSVHVTRGSTFANAANLSAAAVKEFLRQYGRSRIGRQELYGELLTTVEGALWRTEWLEAGRVRNRRQVPELVTVAVALDPAVADSPDSDESGLVAVGRGADGHDYVLADWSKRVVGSEAARRAWLLWLHVKADVMVYETNQGDSWVRDVLRSAWDELKAEGLVSGNPPLQGVNARRGKRLRAEPVAARYEAGYRPEPASDGSPVGNVHHVGRFEKLETQMTEWLPSSKTSPDRLDALVHALAYLDEGSPVDAVVASPAVVGRAGGYVPARPATPTPDGQPRTSNPAAEAVAAAPPSPSPARGIGAGLGRGQGRRPWG